MLNKIVALVILGGVILLSCTKKSTDSPVAPDLKATFKFTIGNTSYEWSGSPATLDAGGSHLQRTVYNNSAWYTLTAYPANAGIYTGVYLRIIHQPLRPNHIVTPLPYLCFGNWPNKSA